MLNGQGVQCPGTQQLRSSIMQERVDRLKIGMEKQEVDVSIVLKPHNVFCLSGSAPLCSGLLIFRQVPPIEVCIWLDGKEVQRDSSFTRVAGYRFPEFSMSIKMVEDRKSVV